MQNGIDTNCHPDPDRRAVLRFDDRLSGGDRAFVTVVFRFRSPFTQNAGRPADHHRAIIERGIFDERAGKQTVLECRRVNERLHRRAGRTPRLKRAIVLVVFEIAPANEHEDSGRLIIQRDQRALQIIGRHRLVRHRYLFRALEPIRVNVVGRVIVTRMLLRFREMFAN